MNRDAYFKGERKNEFYLNESAPKSHFLIN